MTITKAYSFQDLPPLVKHMLGKHVASSTAIPFCALQTEGLHDGSLYTAIVITKKELLLATLFQPGGISDGLLEMIEPGNIRKVNLKSSRKESVVEIYMKELDFSLFAYLHPSEEGISNGSAMSKRVNPDKMKFVFDSPESAETFTTELKKLA